MTDDATDGDRSVEATTDLDARTIDRVLLGDIAARQIAVGVPADLPFILIDIRVEGLRIGIVDPRLEAVVGERLITTIRPDVIDRLLADHLVRTGRVEEPATDEWTSELLELAARGRERLASSDATFIMGQQNVRFFRVAQRDLDEATAPLRAEIALLCDQAAAAVADPVASVVLDSGHHRWPGLSEMLGDAVTLPVVAVEADRIVDERPRRHHDPVGEAMTEPVVVAEPEVPQADPVAVGSVVDAGQFETPVPEQVPQPNQSGDFPVAWVDAAITPTTDPIAVVRDDVHALRDTTGTYAAPYEPLAPYLLDAPTTVDDPSPRTIADTGPVTVVQTGYHPREWALDPDHTPATATIRERPIRERRRTIIRAAIALGAVCVIVGLAVAGVLAVTGDETSERAEVPVAADTTTPTPTRAYADPADVVEAGLPAARYTPPPPPPPPTTADEPTRQQNQPRNRPQPRQRVIPNPIPGLPPIVLPF
ncbi:hypothetical protein V1Y59_21945 [Gordonia sp. PKS22-38]|uniref:Uncharacterized protein n=1 Tax=Gordonia prachuapensis TaxID=3115651 RepID=A0ABU7MZS6_9ACTN|nr:hypothetical protein [Gordonia sp. PKS22-38]